MTWEDFEADTETFSTPHKGSRCGVQMLLDTLDEDGRGALEVAMGRQEFTNPALIKAIRKRVDTKLSIWTMGNHRRGDCACKNG